MVTRIVCAAFFCVLSLFVCMAHSEPFGLDMGATTNELATIKDEGSPKGMFRFLEVERPRSDYSTYIGQFSASHGLCWVKAIGIDVPSDAIGTEVKAQFELESERLGKMYGAMKNFDFRFSGNSDDDLENWLQAVSEGDRYVAAIWDRWNGAVLPDTLESVGLVLNAYSNSLGYLSLEYTFNNIALCEKELTQTQ